MLLNESIVVPIDNKRAAFVDVCTSSPTPIPLAADCTNKTHLTAQGVPLLQHCNSYKRLKRRLSSPAPSYLPYFKRIDKHIQDNFLRVISSSMPSMTPPMPQMKSTLSLSTSDIEDFRLNGPEDGTAHAREKAWSQFTLKDIDYIQMIGTGMYSKVHLVQARETKEHFALKVMPKYKAIKKRSSAPIKNEAEIMLSLKHPLIVRTWNTFEDEKNFYMLMDFAAGGELFYHLRGSGKFDEHTARFYAAEVVMALEYLHSNNIAYRDLKLENLVLSPEGHIQLTDFGFAKYMELDTTFTLCGTPEYLAPEIIRGTGYGMAVDWWALGVLLFEMLAGYSPFYHDNPLDIYKSILRGGVRFSSCMSENAVHLLKGLLSRDVSQRMGTVRNGVSELRAHPFFDGIEWRTLHLQTPPIVPSIGSGGDTRYFELDHDGNDTGSEHAGADATSDGDDEDNDSHSEGDDDEDGKSSNSSSSSGGGSDSEVERLFEDF